MKNLKHLKELFSSHYKHFFENFLCQWMGHIIVQQDFVITKVLIRKTF